MSSRELTVQPLLRKLAYRREKVVPQLTLSGNWLAAAGFEPSTKVSVLVANGKITIKAAE